jgi:predicted secreted hydrolase
VASTPCIQLPQDQYAHVGAPSEWWWHIGTLRSGDRLFGFEINATGRPDGGGGGGPSYGFAQIMLSDVANQAHYQTTSAVSPLPDGWAQSDPAKPWSVAIAGDLLGKGEISMQAAADNCYDMQVAAQFADQATGTIVRFDVRFVQSGPPLLVWGTGCNEVNPGGKTPLEQNNYYYSFTNLAASGTVSIGGETVAVEGTTWMDHEYGYFGTGQVNWVLQDMQLDNGYSLSSFAVNAVPRKDVAYASKATILGPDGTSRFVDTVTTPRGDPRPSKGDKGVDYYLQMDVAIIDPPASLSVISILADQEFPIPGSAIYEGAARVTGSFDGKLVTGTGWLEEKIKAATLALPAEAELTAAMPVPA